LGRPIDEAGQGCSAISKCPIHVAIQFHEIVEDIIAGIHLAAKNEIKMPIVVVVAPRGDTFANGDEMGTAIGEGRECTRRRRDGAKCAQQQQSNQYSGEGADGKRTVLLGHDDINSCNSAVTD
jgi:hypothetical protein